MCISNTAMDCEDSGHLPPHISSNHHPKVLAGKIPLEDIKLKQKERGGHRRQTLQKGKEERMAQSAFPITIRCTPDHLRFDLFEEPITTKIGFMNSSARTIQLQCCGLWDDTSRLGASWSTYPRSRFWLAPGIQADIFVRAVPKPTAPIAMSCSALQIAATHLRDSVTAYFVVPIMTCFLKYIPPSLHGSEEELNEVL